jgi:ribonuclease HI
MSTKSPHYVLYSDALNSEGEGGRRGGRWHFVLEALDGESVIEAGEHEPDPTTRGERLELLSVVRGLEALDQPSRVTLITPSRYVRRGLRFGLEEWRHNRWRWEHFGKLVPIKNQDLWQRVDRALRYHEVKCRWWRLDADHGSLDNAAF